MKPCGVKWCKADIINNPNIKLHSFPKDKNLRSVWISNIGEENLHPGYQQVCSIHFENKWIINTQNRERLKINATPTLFLSPVRSMKRKIGQPGGKCCVPLCKNESSNRPKSRDITFHLFPREPQMRQRWLNALGMEGNLRQGQIYINSVVCSEHFANEDLYIGKNGYRMIHTGAIPLIIQDTLEDMEGPEQRAVETLQICRICLNTDCKLFPIHQCKLNETYQNLTGFSMVDDARVSQTFCAECAQRLMNFDRFREKSLRADILLSTVLKKTVSTIKDHIKSLDRVNFQLTSNLIETVLNSDHFDLIIQEDQDIDENTDFSNEMQEDTDVRQVKREMDDTECEPLDKPYKKYDNSTTVQLNSRTDHVTPSSYHKSRVSDAISKLREPSFQVKVEKVQDQLPTKADQRVQVDYVPVIYDVVIDDKFKIVKREDILPKTQSSVEDDYAIPGDDENTVVERVDEATPAIKMDPDENQVLEYDYNEIDEDSIEETVITEDYLEVASDDVPEHAIKLEYREVVETHKDPIDDPVKRSRRNSRRHAAIEPDVTDTNEEYSNSNWNNEDGSEGNWSADNENKDVPKVKVKKAFKRRSAVPDGLNDVIFTIKKLNLEEQVAELKSRLTTSSKNADYICRYCYRGFMDASTHTRHMNKHTSEYGEYECVVCKLHFRTSRMMLTHRALRHSTKYMCNLCDFVTTGSEPARQHGLRHKGIAYNCPHCSEEYLRYTVLMDHILLEHTPEGICVDCGLKFPTFEELYQHKTLKHNIDDEVPEDGPHCDVCNIYFASDFAYKQHLAVSIKHNSDFVMQHLAAKTDQYEEMAKSEYPKKKKEEDIVGSMECEQCGQELPSLRKYHAHFRRYHPDKTRTFYPTMKTKVMCELCGKFFRAQWHYMEHLRMHNNERPYSCEHCGKSFVKRHLLRNHRFMHSDQRPDIKCKECGRRFANRSNLHRHMACHTGEKRFKCDLCGRRYRSKGEQQSHYDHVHLRKPWPKRVRPKRDKPNNGTAASAYVKSESEEDTTQTVIEECVEEMEIEY